jgi:hypothetical protein
MVTTYRTTCWGEIYEVAADWARASDAVHGCSGNQVADFQHYPQRAMLWLLEQDARNGGFCEEGTLEIDSVTRAEIQTAICDMHEVMGKEVGDAR